MTFNMFDAPSVAMSRSRAVPLILYTLVSMLHTPCIILYAAYAMVHAACFILLRAGAAKGPSHFLLDRAFS